MMTILAQFSHIILTTADTKVTPINTLVWFCVKYKADIETGGGCYCTTQQSACERFLMALQHLTDNFNMDNKSILLQLLYLFIF